MPATTTPEFLGLDGDGELPLFTPTYCDDADLITCLVVLKAVCKQFSFGRSDSVLPSYVTRMSPFRRPARLAAACALY